MEQATAPVGATPPAVEAAKPAQAAAPAPVSSLNQPSDLGERAKSAKTYAEIKAIISDGRKQVPLKQEAPVAEAPQATAPEPTPEATEGTAPEAEGQPDPTPAETTPEVTAAQEAEDGELGDIPTAKQLRIAPPEADKLGRKTAALMRRNRDLTMEQAMVLAKEQLGIKPAAEVATPDAKPGLPATVEAVDASLESLETERGTALTALDFEAVAKIDRQLRLLDRQRTTLERAAERKQSEAHQNFERTFDLSETRAQELYEFVNVPDSPGRKRMIEIEKDLEEAGDPLFHSPDKPLKIAQMVANELLIAPRRKGSPAAPAKAAVAPPPAPPKPKQVLPTGASRTTQPVANQQPALQAEVNKVRRVHDLRKLYKSVGIR